jgi:hypothetical protein
VVFFGKLTRHSLKGANILSLDDLRETIGAYVKFHNETPKPYSWRKREVKGAQLRNTCTSFCNKPLVPGLPCPGLKLEEDGFPQISSS